jgi:hypothetical protein
MAEFASVFIRFPTAFGAIICTSPVTESDFRCVPETPEQSRLCRLSFSVFRASGPVCPALK